MNKIFEKRQLAEKVTLYDIEAARIARKFKAGQFVIIRPYEGGERIPLTIADADIEKGTITLVVQEVGKTTSYMAAELQKGDSIADVVGPLGNPTQIENKGTILGIGGGIGIAPLYPILKAHTKKGNKVLVIQGARTQELLILQDWMHRIADEIFLCTEDGSAGSKGLVTDLENNLLQTYGGIQEIIAIGPAIMMKFCVETARPYRVPVMVSLNPIMVDGTGMCGGCRIRYENSYKFVCVDGPEFDGYKVDFDRLMARQRMYQPQERQAYKEYTCRLDKQVSRIKRREFVEDTFVE